MQKFLELGNFVVSEPSTRVSIDFLDVGPFLELNFLDGDGTKINPYPQFFMKMGIEDYQVEAGYGESVEYKLPVDIFELPRFLKGEKEVVRLLFFLIKNRETIENNFEFFTFCIHPGHLPEVKYIMYHDLCMDKDDKKAFKAARKFVTKLLLKFPQLQEGKKTICFCQDIGPVPTQADLLTLP